MIIACDLDHTLFHAAWRDDLMPADPRDNWDKYHAAGKQDKAAIPILELIFALHNAGHEIYIVTARPRKWLRQTYGTLHSIGIKVEEDHILMRTDDKFCPSPPMKEELLAHLKVDLLIEDRLDVVEHFVKLGVTTLQVRLVS